MRIVVVGASGNVGTSVLRELADDPAVESVLGLSRRLPGLRFPKVEWRSADVTESPLESLFQNADAVVHLAWLIQPARDRALTRRVNVEGSERVLRAVARTRVPALIYASSVGAYAPGPKDRRVDESWPTTGIDTSFYSADKAAVERLLDRFEREEPGIRVVRMRPGLTFSREAAAEIRRLFAGPFLPGSLVRPELIPLVPDVDRLVFQAVHSRDVGRAYRIGRALVEEIATRDVRILAGMRDPDDFERVAAGPARIPRAPRAARPGGRLRLRSRSGRRLTPRP